MAQPGTPDFITIPGRDRRISFAHIITIIESFLLQNRQQRKPFGNRPRACDLPDLSHRPAGADIGQKHMFLSRVTRYIV
jgi:hypothetical protein